MNGWRKACRVLAVLVAVGLAVLVGVRKKGEQPDETDESSVLAEGPAVWQSIEGFVSEMGRAANTEQSEGVISGEMPGPEPENQAVYVAPSIILNMRGKKPIPNCRDILKRKKAFQKARTALVF